MRKKTFITVFFVAISFGLCQPLYPWGDSHTHPALSKEAAGVSQVDNYLRNQLSMNEGLNTQLQLDTDLWPVPDLVKRGLDPDMNTQTILAWLETGSTLEDGPLRQARHHFHAPIANPGVSPPNPNAGLDHKTQEDN